MARNRRKIFVKGLGSLEILQIDPTPDTRFVSVGYLGGTMLNDVYDMEEVRDETGLLADYLSKGQAVSIDTSLLQSEKAQLDRLRNAKTQLHAVRYFGQESANSYKWISGEIARLNPSISQKYMPGLRTLPLGIKILSQQELSFPIPAYYLIETAGPMGLEGLSLWASPRQGYNQATARVLDASGFARHGLISSAFATIWQGAGTGTPAYFLRLDGTADNVDFGDVNDVDATADFGFEVWVRIKGADGALQEIYGKKAADANEAGHRLVRTAGNKISFKLSDGTNSATVVSAANVLQNIWTLVGFQGMRLGNGQLFINGVADGTAVSLAGVTGSAANALSLILGAFNGGFGQIDASELRWFDYGAASMPADFATRMANHFAAEHAFHGV